MKQSRKKTAMKQSRKKTASRKCTPKAPRRAARPVTPAPTDAGAAVASPVAAAPSAPVATAPPGLPSVPAPPAAPAPQAAIDVPVPIDAPVPPLTPAPLFLSDYTFGLQSWQAVQQPLGTQRVTTTDAPGDPGSPFRPSGKVMRVELRAGDLTNTGGHIAPRAEVYGRWMKSSVPAEGYPDPAGSVRWYAFSLYVPADFPTATDTTWLTLTQWKGQFGGSPPVALEIKRGDLRVGGARGYSLPTANLGPLNKGGWTRVVVGMKLSPDPDIGWIEVYRDGEQKVVRTPLATMDRLQDGSPDPVYLKQGLYRSSRWNVTQVLYFSSLGVYPESTNPAALFG